MKSLRRNACSSESRTIKKPAQGNTNRTLEFGKDPFGRTKGINAPIFSEADFAALAHFAEGAFASASALFSRLKKLQPNDPSLDEIGALLKRANLSFREFKARTQGCPMGVTP